MTWPGVIGELFIVLGGERRLRGGSIGRYHDVTLISVLHNKHLRASQHPPPNKDIFKIVKINMFSVLQQPGKEYLIIALVVR